MDVSEPNTLLEELVAEIGEAGQQVTRLNAAEGAAGNISVFAQTLEGLLERFPFREEYPLPVRCPALTGGWVVVTGTGRRLRDIAARPEKNLCILRILPGADQAWLFAAEGVRPTSELNSHLSIHQEQVSRRGVKLHAVLHAQPRSLTFLSHLPAYADPEIFSRRLLRWEPETVLVFPEGIGLIRFQLPGSREQMEATSDCLRHYRVVVWARHGVVTRSDEGPLKAADLVEYAETAAEYELMNLRLGEPSMGIPEEEIRRLKIKDKG